MLSAQRGLLPSDSTRLLATSVLTSWPRSLVLQKLNRSSAWAALVRISTSNPQGCGQYIEHSSALMNIGSRIPGAPAIVGMAKNAKDAMSNHATVRAACQSCGSGSPCWSDERTDKRSGVTPCRWFLRCRWAWWLVSSVTDRQAIFGRWAVRSHEYKTTPSAIAAM